jgi:hypothetical protein
MCPKRIVTPIGVVVTATALLVGCTGGPAPDKGAQNAAYEKLLRDAAGYVSNLRNQDKLPGFHPGDHGSLTSIPEPVWDNGPIYPVSVVLRGEKEGDESLYRYTIMKQNEQSPWRLVEATRWDKSGHVTQQMLPK